MNPRAWNRRFLESTRGRIVALLRESERTVNELAGALGLTANAIRNHLASLERDGLVRRQGVRRGAYKPHTTYALTPDAEHLFPRPYEPLLRALLDAMADRLPPEAADETARAAGHRLAANYPPAPPGSGPRERAARAVAVLADFGGHAAIEDRNGALAVRSADGCPLAAVVAGHPEVCRLMETVLSDVAGVAMRETCQRGDAPKCSFQVGAADGQGAARG
jgi:predicted ArsR family transcriptional regulator